MRKHTIEFSGLKIGLHEYVFELDSAFFEGFENEEILGANIIAKVQLTKQETLMILEIKVNGVIQLQCDRCLDQYDQAIDDETKLYIKFGEETLDEGDEIIIIAHEAHKIDITQNLYETSMLSLPIVRKHPDDEFGKSTCNPEVLERMSQYIVEELDENDSEDEEELDSNSGANDAWKEQLKKLLDNE